MAKGKQNQADNKNKPDLVAMARKKRHLYLVQKMHQDKVLTPVEIRELAKFEGKPIAPGIVQTQEEVAKVFGISVRTVQYWAKDGMPKTEKGTYDLVDIQRWRFEKNNTRNSGKNSEKDEWETRLKKSKAKLAEIELKKALGEVISTDEVEKARIARIMAVKRALLALPRAVAPILAGLEARDIEILLTSRIREMIAKFAGQRQEDEKPRRKITRKNTR